MALKTRGSAAIDKAQRRLALLKSIDHTLDLGYGLTVTNYNGLLEQTRTSLEAYNTLLSKVDEARANLEQAEKALSQMSERMLSGVATKYGKSSVEYAKAGGSTRKRSKAASQPATEALPTRIAEMNGSQSSQDKSLAVN
ncbi:hypothetical protein [Leptolyngbya sp. FACHB-17]|uniref:hypothetical protein n=1 Tax=unclassified Leptolyngbya TaxID=2650499 RepID=UPI0016806CE2|nr:hypothetical protein [Leptolyngbya sp. FACHB-17]MBD2080311.1 hypothetical protein [Leptolyngbya sp. FACHB-17]